MGVICEMKENCKKSGWWVFFYPYSTHGINAYGCSQCRVCLYSWAL